MYQPEASGVVIGGNARYGVPRLDMLDINAPIPEGLMSPVFFELARDLGADIVLCQELGRMQMAEAQRVSGLAHGVFAAMFDPLLQRPKENHLGVAVLSKYPIMSVRRIPYAFFDGMTRKNWEGAARLRPQRCVLLATKIKVPWLKMAAWFATTHFMMSQGLVFEPEHWTGMETLVEQTLGFNPILLELDANQDRDEVVDGVVQPGKAWSVLTELGRFEDIVPRSVKTTFDPSSPAARNGLEAVIDWFVRRGGFPMPEKVDVHFGRSDHGEYAAQFPLRKLAARCPGIRGRYRGAGPTNEHKRHDMIDLIFSGLYGWLSAERCG